MGIVRAIRNIRGGPGVTVRYAPGGGITIARHGSRPRQPEDVTPFLTRFIIFEEQADILVCRRPGDDGTSGIPPTNVIKPQHLRGYIAERTVEDSEFDDDTQFIYPPYGPLEGEKLEVFAFQNASEPSFWYDSNLPANRQWMTECHNVS